MEQDPPIVVEASLVASLEVDAVRIALGALEASTYHSMLAEVATERGLPRSVADSQSAAVTNEQRAEFTSLGIALAEAINRLVGAGVLVPTGPAHYDNVPVSFTIRRTHSSGGGEARRDLEVSAPNRFRPSTDTREAHAAGTLAIRHPDLYLRDLPAMSPRVSACLREAVEAYRVRLPLATLILLGAASEAAWLEVGEAVADSLADTALAADLANERLGIAAKQANIVARIADQLGGSGRVPAAIARTTGLHGDWLQFLAHFYADLRNYAAHRDARPLPIDMNNAATMLYQAHDYFAALYRLPQVVTAATPPGTGPTRAPVPPL